MLQDAGCNGGGTAVEAVPTAELEAARRLWEEGRANAPLPVKREHPM